MAKREADHSGEPEKKGSPEVEYNVRIKFPSDISGDRFFDHLTTALILSGIDGPSINKRVSVDRVERDESGQEIFEHIPQVGPRQ